VIFGSHILVAEYNIVIWSFTFARKTSMLKRALSLSSSDASQDERMLAIYSEIDHLLAGNAVMMTPIIRRISTDLIQIVGVCLT
jgi:hypothetical protein